MSGVAAAIQAAASRARAFGISRRAFTESVLSVAERDEDYQRAHHVIERREAVLVVRPAHGVRASKLEPIPALPHDPWAADPGQVERDSRVFATCPTCHGAKRIACTRCGGHGRLGCPGCRATGMVYGQRGRKKCPQCRGRRDVKCVACVSGKVECGGCEGAGRVEACIHIVQHRIDRVAVHPQGVATSAHAHVLDPRDFDTRPDLFAGELLADERRGPDDVPRELFPNDFNTRTDRVQAVRVQTFRSPRYRIEYGTAVGHGHVDVVGRYPATASTSDWRPLRRRRSLVALVGAAALLVALILPCVYIGRHAWFAAHGHGGRVFLLALAAAALATIATLGLTLHHRVRTLARAWIPVGALASVCAASALVFATSNPSIADARQFLAAGAIERAEDEARALNDLGLDRSAAQELLDSIHLRRLREAPTIDAMDRLRQELWYAPTARSQADAALRTAVVAAIPARASANDAEGLRRLRSYSNLIGSSATVDLDRRVTLLELEGCFGASDYGCVESKLEDARRLGIDEAQISSFRTRAAAGVQTTITQLEGAPAPTSGAAEVQHLERELLYARQYERLSGAQPSPPPQRLEHRLAQARLRAEAEARTVARHAEAEARRAEAARAQAQRLAAREAARRDEEERRRRRRWAPLRCCDGTLSPSCTCSGSRRGCCSHHGGVCGGCG